MTSHQLSLLILALALTVLLAFGAGTLARRFGQPSVVGEVILGVALGPTLLNGSLTNWIFPAEIRPFLTALADIGVALFMFTVGTELDATLHRGSRLVAGIVAAGSIALPFGLGTLAAAYLYSGHQTGSRTGFILFMGAAMSVTAFPVLARILADRGMSRTWLGNVALTSAAIDDVLAWSLLAIVVTIIGSAAGSQWLPLLFAPYLVLMATVVRPALAWILTRRRVTAAGSPGALAVTIAGLLASAAFTEWIGLHFIFGAFLFGVVMPRGAAPDPPADGPGALGDQISRVNNILLLPVFFVVAGLKVNLTGMSAKDVVDLCVILVVAVAGKFLGAFVAARLCGLRSNEAGALAILMNTRGLTELIILTVGLQLGVLDARLYSDMVVMALVTTAMAGPLLQAVYPLRSTPPGVDPSVISGPPASPTAR